MKSILTYLIIFIFLLVSCNPAKKQETVAISKAALRDSLLQNSPDTSEYIDWQKSKINGMIFVLSHPKITYQILGIPDHISPLITQYAGYYPSESFKNVSIKGCQFELYESIDVLVLRKIYFSNTDINFITQNYTLKRGTTLTALSKIYRQAVNRSYKVSENNEDFDAIELPVEKPDTIPSVDGNPARWILLFQKGQLTELDYNGSGH
jgi:hypothetical protein